MNDESAPPGAALDVVVVPDFEGPAAAVFTARTLFFLASWLEHAGRARAFPLHLACIGEPPDSVRKLAAKAGAQVHVFPRLAMQGGRYINKLRGLEVPCRTGRYLLLDADILILNDFADLGKEIPGLAASPSVHPRVPMHWWIKIYERVGVPFPRERIISGRGALGLSLPKSKRGSIEKSELVDMIPYYNSGVLLIPADCGLLELWGQYTQQIAELAGGRNKPKCLVATDQTPLAVALECLKRRGVAFAELPTRFHVHYLHLYGRAFPFDQAAIFHAFRFARHRKTPVTDPGDFVRLYRSDLIRDMIKEWTKERGVVRITRAFTARLIPALRDVSRLVAEMNQLYERHIRPVLGR